MDIVKCFHVVEVPTGNQNNDIPKGFFISAHEGQSIKLSQEAESTNDRPGSSSSQVIGKPTKVIGGAVGPARAPVVEALWKRRGARPIPPLTLDPIIRCDVPWDYGLPEGDAAMEIVHPSEWVARTNYFEVHSIEDIAEGVVINPPTYPGWYKVERTGAVIPAQFSFAVDRLLSTAQKHGYNLCQAARAMGTIVTRYSSGLIHPKRRHYQKILVLAGQHWRGSAGIFAAQQLLRMGFLVGLYIAGCESTTGPVWPEEQSFLRHGGRLFKNLNDMRGQTFRVVVVALENQAGRMSVLPLFGEWLQTSVAVFVDPPVLKCSLVTALQIATRGGYNICQKTAVFLASHPKSFIIDHFLDMYVVDIGVSKEMCRAGGMEPVLPNVDLMRVIPQPFTAKGSKIYFYEEGVPVHH